MMRLLACLLSLGLLLAAAATPAAAQRREGQCQVQFEPRSPSDSVAAVFEQQFSGRYNAFQGGGVRYRCQGQAVTITADSAAYYGDLNILYMIGNVRYRGDQADIDADRLTYYRNEEWVIAEGNVLARLEDGSTMRGPAAEYFRAVPGVRSVQRLVSTGRPTLRLVQRDSTGGEAPPTTVIADRIAAEGDSLVYAGGQVRIERPDVTARADSAVLDEVREFVQLLRSPQIEGKGERPFTLVGAVVDLYSRERELQRVVSAQNARVVSEDVTVASDTLDLRLVDRALERAYAWGPSRARATSPGREIVADSLDVRLADQRLREVFALGTARIESAADTLRISAPTRDWLAGDTIVAQFDAEPAADDTSSQPRLRELVARGAARSYQQIPPDTGRTARPSANYTVGDLIVVTFSEGEPAQVRVTAADSGKAYGVYLDASGTSANARDQGPPRSPGGRPPRGRVAPPPGGARDE